MLFINENLSVVKTHFTNSSHWVMDFNDEDFFVRDIKTRMNITQSVCLTIDGLSVMVPADMYILLTSLPDSTLGTIKAKDIRKSNILLTDMKKPFQAKVTGNGHIVNCPLTINMTLANILNVNYLSNNIHFLGGMKNVSYNLIDNLTPNSFF